MRGGVFVFDVRKTTINTSREKEGRQRWIEESSHGSPINNKNGVGEEVSKRGDVALNLIDSGLTVK